MNDLHRAYRSKVSLLFLTALCLPLFLTGCETLSVGVGNQPEYREESGAKGPPPWAPAHGYRAKHRYHYYPSAQVYYADDRGVYIYYSHGAWQVSASLPGNLRVSQGNAVTLEMDTDKPYKYHSDVVRRYPPGQEKKKGKGHGKGHRK